MQAGNEAAVIGLFAAAGPMAEPENIRAVLVKPRLHRQVLGPVYERYVSRLAIILVTH